MAKRVSPKLEQFIDQREEDYWHSGRTSHSGLGSR